jgi:hypothetical protein
MNKREIQKVWNRCCREAESLSLKETASIAAGEPGMHEAYIHDAVGQVAEHLRDVLESFEGEFPQAPKAVIVLALVSVLREQSAGVLYEKRGGMMEGGERAAR